MVESSQGLLRMSQRLELIGSRVQVNSSPGQGTRIIIHVPESSNPYSSKQSQ
jgi:signal transduction histidine kinase